jgi:thiosulfate reductase/polysulfide reductase chain A
MRDIQLVRRDFLKILGVTSIAGGTGLLGFPSPLKASKKQEGNRSARFLNYERGEYSPNYCEMCFWKCGVNVYTVNGKIKKLEGNKTNPNNLGHLCAKGNAGIQSTYDPDRVQYPMIRVGKRGEGKWKKVSWDEAFTYIHEKLTPIFETYGHKSLATFMHGTGEKYAHTLSYALGTPNVVVPSYSQCVGSREIAWSKTFGFGVSGHEIYDIKNTKNMIVFGRNLAGAIHVGEAERFVEGIARGAKLTYIDPRLSETAVKANRWLQINPGTDMALALSMIHVIMRDNLADMDFVRKYCYGYNELHEHVKQYSPKWAEEKTGIKAKEIEEITWEFAKDAPNVLAIPPRRMTRYGNDVQTVRAIAILNALMGNVGVPGGQFIRNSVPIKKPHEIHPPAPLDKRADGAGTKFPFAPTNLGIADALYTATLTQEPYPIKAWLLYATNPLGHGSTENGSLFDAMDNVDFIMAIDTQLNDSAFYADIVLPESTYLERDDVPLMQKDALPFIALRKAAVTAVYDTKHAFDICKGIAEKFGVEKYFEKSPTQYMKEVVESLSQEQAATLEKDGTLVFDTLEPYPHAAGKRLKFSTTTQKIQLYVPDFEKYFEEFGDDFAPMPTYKDPKMPSSGELRLLMGRAPNHAHARTQNNWILMELYGNNPIWIHPKDAQKNGLKDGDKVKVVNVKTNYESKAQDIKITDRIKENSVFIHHGFGHITKAWSIGSDVGISDTNFCSHDTDPISGACGFNNGFVTIKKA